MLLKHIDDPDEMEEKNIALVDELKEEKEKLIRRLDGFCEMRADGEISRDEYKQKKTETENRILEIDKQIEQLIPAEVLHDISPEEEATHADKIALLRYYLEASMKQSETEDIPDDVIIAFVRKIVVHPDGFDWFLRFSEEDAPQQLKTTGKRKEAFQISTNDSFAISSFCSPQDRPPSRKADFPVV